MIAVLLLPAILSLLLLAAHFLRSANYLAVLGLLALIPLLALRRAWVMLVARSTLWLGTGVWLYTIARFTAERLRLGEPYLRMVAVLGGVALCTALSSLAFGARRLRVWYGAAAAPPPQGTDTGTGTGTDAGTRTAEEPEAVPERV